MKKTWLRPENPWERGSEWLREVLGGEKSREIERDWAKWELNHEDPIYTNSVILDRSRGVERCWALKGLTDAAIE